ncbi:hypothetical protein ACOSQ3_008864 [Xanthoceras sorbifolium]
MVPTSNTTVLLTIALSWPTSGSSYPFGQPFLLREDRSSSSASLSSSVLPLPSLVRDDWVNSGPVDSPSPSSLSLPLLASPWWTVIGSDRGRSRAAGSFHGQMTGVAWGFGSGAWVRLGCLELVL